MRLPAEKKAIREKCYHPSKIFVEFPIGDVEGSVPERFEKIVRMHPERLAVKAEDGQLTYAELNAQANRIARKIAFHREISPSSVAILLEKSPAAVAAIMGVFKTGEIQIALDPSYPEDRLRTIFNDAECQIVITNRRYSSLAEKLLKRRAGIINLDELNEGISGENLGFQIGPECYSNIIYTSGSTGKPKGVLHDHRHVLYYAMVYTRSHHTSSEDCLSCLYPMGVAGIMRDLLQALLTGASISLYDVKARGFDGLANWLIEEKVTIYRSVPTVFRNFLRTLKGREMFTHIRVVHLAGEHVRRTDVELWRNHFSSKSVFVTGLGITEAGKVTENFIDHDSVITDSTVSAGYPVEGMEIFIRGQDNNLNSARRIVGEVAVKSSYLPPGYWRRPELTRAKYADDSSGCRVYLTGDLGCVLPDGSIQLFGRVDAQTKVNGFTVDVSEVEIALLELDAVRSAVVTVKGGGGEHERLVAYIVINSAPGPSVRTLRQALVMRVPIFMIPSSFVVLEELPLLPNGKVNLGALPDPPISRPELDSVYTAPRTSDERRLAKIWAEVLSLDQAGIYDSVFDLGGDSLAAMRIVSRVLKEFELEIPLSTLLEKPTVAAMAKCIRQYQTEVADAESLQALLGEVEEMSDEEAQRDLDEDN